MRWPFGRLRRRLWNALAETLFPCRCLRCGALYLPSADGTAAAAVEPGLSGRYFAALLAPHFCPDCRLGYGPLTAPLCPRCGRYYPDRRESGHLCQECQQDPGPIAEARAAGLHGGPLKAAIQSLKYRGKLQLAAPLGSLLEAARQTHWPAGGWGVVLAVPLHPRRLRQRGFNQVDLLIRRGWRSAEAVAVHRPGILVRRRATPPQAGRDRAARRRNIRGAFQVTDPAAVEGRRILLVDDVLTTGATAEECARALLAAGAWRVDLLTLSRVEPRGGRSAAGR
jgi:ComF family protein